MANQLATRGAPDFKAALGEQLVAAHGRLRRRRRRRQVVLSFAAVVVIGLFATASLSMFGSTPAAADVIRIDELSNGSRLVTIQHADAMPGELQKALRDALIDNITTGVTTGPSRVGTIIALAFNGAPATRSSTSDPRSLLIPADFEGVVEITIGQAASPGQPYEQPTSPFDPGEPLDGFEKRTDITAVIAAATAKGLTVTVIGVDGKPVASARPGAPLIAATMTASDVLALRVAI